MKILRMEPWLPQYPKPRDEAVIRDGFTFGSWIPFTPENTLTFSDNLKSANERPETVASELEQELALGRMAGPFMDPPHPPPPPNLQSEGFPLGAVLEREPNTFRLIHHLSFPKDTSVNDGIDKDESQVHYTSFDKALALLRDAGPDALMAKSDIQSAFRLLLLHQKCFHLLGCLFKGGYYYDRCFPMGCAISCYFFELFSSFLEWVIIVESCYQSILHANFRFVGPANTSVAQHLLETFCRMLGYLGVPIVEDKTEGPVQLLCFWAFN